MKYNFELAEQDLEFDEIDPHGLGLPATLYLLADGERVSFAREAIEYYCTPKDGGVIYHFAVKNAIRNGTFEEEYNVTFNMATDDEIIEQLVAQSEPLFLEAPISGLSRNTRPSRKSHESAIYFSPDGEEILRQRAGASVLPDDH